MNLRNGMSPASILGRTTLLFLSVLTPLPLHAATWHVEGDGDDSKSGTSVDSAFRTLQRAAKSVTAGDTVLVGNGIYENDPKTEASVVTLSTSGKPDSWITWKARPNTHPELRPTGWGGIVVTGSYIILDGFNIVGRNDSIFLAEALLDAKNPKASGRFNTNGIFVNGRKNSPETKPHHIVIRNCNIGKCPGGGIAIIEADYVTVEDCKIFENAWYMRYGGSGISTLNNWAFDDKPGYHIVVQRNFVWNNRCLVPWEKIGKLSDGNGIILDVTDLDGTGTNPNNDALVNNPAMMETPPVPLRPEWKGRALVANNVSCHNGGSGIHTFRTKYVDIVNNTTYFNGGVVGYPEIFSNTGEDINILNNIIFPRPNGKVTSNNKNKQVHWDYNLYPVGPAVLTGEHDLVADPLFLDLRLNPTEGNFRLKPGSPALNSGSSDLAQPADILGNLRPAGGGHDRGAYEQ